MTSTELSEVEKSLEEIPHPSLPEGSSVVATTGTDAGLAVALVDVDDAVDAARRSMGHLRDRRPASYAELPVPARAG